MNAQLEKISLLYWYYYELLLYLLFLRAAIAIFCVRVLPSLCCVFGVTARLENCHEVFSQKVIGNTVGILQLGALLPTGPKTRPTFPYPFHDIRPESGWWVALDIVADETPSGPIVV